MGKRYTIAVDFDGVIHSYTSPWKNLHTIPDPPVEGAMAWLWDTLQHFDIVIFSTRCKSWRGRRAMRAWLKEHGRIYWRPMPDSIRSLDEIRFAKSKPPALIYLDDRAVRFDGPGTFPTADEIHRARPWNKPRKGGPRLSDFVGKFDLSECAEAMGKPDLAEELRERNRQTG